MLASSTIIQNIDATRKVGLASQGFFYCDFREDQKRDLRGLLSSLLVQLCHQSDSYDILLKFYEEHAEGSQHPSGDALTGCLKDLLKLPELVQTRSVGVWTGVLVAGSGASPCRSLLSLHPFLPPSSGSSYILGPHLVITPLPPLPCSNTLSLILHKQAASMNSTFKSSAATTSHSVMPTEQRRIVSIPQHHFHDQRACCPTSPQIAAASARALPARASHLSGWIHRLRPTALHACPCP
jgi:hypothetical protein